MGPPRSTLLRSPAGRALRTCASWLGLAGAVTLLSGGFCGGGGGPPIINERQGCEDAPAPTGAAVELGVGQEGPFTKLQGQALQIHYGPQGGQHLYVTVRLYGGDPADSWTGELRLVDAAGAERGRSVAYLRPCAGRWSVTRFVIVYLDAPRALPSATLRIAAARAGSTDPPLRAEAPLSVSEGG